jgi:hypothetical protein
VRLFKAVVLDAYPMQQHDSKRQERALAQLSRHDAELDGLDVEALVNYVEYLALNPGRLWQEASGLATASGLVGLERLTWNRVLPQLSPWCSLGKDDATRTPWNLTTHEPPC